MDEEGEWGESTVYDYGFRVYDPAIARFLSVDPLASDYPWYTPYQFAGNKPVTYVDLDGLEELHYVLYIDRCGDVKLKLAYQEDIKQKWRTRVRDPKGGSKLKSGVHVNRVQRYVLHVEQEVFRQMGPGVTNRGWQYVPLMRYSADIQTITALQYATQGQRADVIKGTVEDAKTAFVKYMAINAAASVAGGIIGRFAPRLLSNIRAAYRSVNTNVELSPNLIRFSQSSVNGADDLIKSMRANGWKGDPIDVVVMRDGALTSMDNTRVLAAHEAGINVRANIRFFDEALQKNLSKDLLQRKVFHQLGEKLWN